MKNRAVLFLCLLMLAACAPTTKVDAEAARQSLMAADQAWSETVGDADAFAARLAPDVFFLPPDQPRVQGPVAFQGVLGPVLELPGSKLTWSADEAEVSEDGSMGYTIGTFELTVAGEDGTPATRVGTYLTIWDRQDDGTWKVAVDTFNFDAPM
jgi:ketosteroid isomerase-like protein